MKRPAPDPADEETGVPGFRTWRGIYVFVVAVFITYVLLLTALTISFHE